MAEQQLQIIKLTSSIMYQRDSKIGNHKLMDQIAQFDTQINHTKAVKDKLQALKDQYEQDYRQNHENFNQALDQKQKNLGEWGLGGGLGGEFWGWGWGVEGSV